MATSAPHSGSWGRAVAKEGGEVAADSIALVKKHPHSAAWMLGGGALLVALAAYACYALLAPGEEEEEEEE
jgi:hypothetical protein